MRDEGGGEGGGSKIISKNFVDVNYGCPLLNAFPCFLSRYGRGKRRGPQISPLSALMGSSIVVHFENLPYHWFTGKTIGKNNLPVKILVKFLMQKDSEIFSDL